MNYRGSSPVAGGAAGWANLANVTDGPPGQNMGTDAIWTNATASAVTTLDVSMPNDVPADALALTFVNLSLRHVCSATARFASLTIQPFDGATAIGSPAALTLSATRTTSAAQFQSSVTVAQIRSPTFKVRVTITRATGTISSTFSIDNIDLGVTWTATSVGRPRVNMGVGSLWFPKPAKVWTGSAWVEKPMKTWTGSAWKTVP